MCPGIALMIGVIVGSGVSALLAVQWLSTPVTVLVSMVFLLGFYPGGGRWPLRRE